MDATQVGSLIGSLGFPIFLVLGALWFVKRDVWPWWTARQAAIDQANAERQDAHDEEENSRHDRYMAAQEEHNDLIREFTTAINGINATMNGVGQLVSAQTNKIDDYHNEIMRELRAKRAT